MSNPLDSDIHKDVRTFPMYNVFVKQTHMHTIL